MRISASRILIVSVVLLRCVLPLAADSPLISAVRAGDLEEARALIGQGADVNARDADGAAALYYAIKSRDADMVELLLAAGASRKSPGPAMPPYRWGGFGALSIALSQEADKLIDMLLETGADPSMLERYADYRIQDAYEDGDADMVEQVLSEFARDTPNFIDYLWYRFSLKDVRRVIGRTYPQLADGTYGLVAALNDLAHAPLTQYDYRPPDIPFPAASSELRDSQVSDRYSADKAFDGTLETSWVEGAAGPGTGESIMFVLPRDTVAVEIYPGYGVEQYCEPNNRVRTGEISISVLSRVPNQFAVELSMAEVYSRRFTLRDEPESQTVPLDLPEVELNPDLDMLVAELTIIDVYPGSRWQDTCIAEIRIR